MSSQPSKYPRLGIISDCDAPSGRMLAVLWEQRGGLFRWEYVSEAAHALRMPVPRRGPPKEWTDLQDFGMLAVFNCGGDLQVSRQRLGCATYQDGKPRRWQGQDVTYIKLRPGIAGYVVLALRNNTQFQEPR